MVYRSAAFAAFLATAALIPGARASDTGLFYSQPLSGEAVRQIQVKLGGLAGYTGPADGNWGPASQTALRNFQQARGLQVTGEMNQATAATMGLDPMALVASAPAAAPAAAAPAPVFALSGDSIRIVQARLRQLGYYNGAIDGAWGGGSQSALQTFQAAQNLPADGRLNKATVEAMGIDTTVMQPPR